YWSTYSSEYVNSVVAHRLFFNTNVTFFGLTRDLKNRCFYQDLPPVIRTFKYFSIKPSDMKNITTVKVLSVLCIVTLSVFILSFKNKRSNVSVPESSNTFSEDKHKHTGAEVKEKYVDYLNGKRVAIISNPTTIIGIKNLFDSMLSL